MKILQEIKFDKLIFDNISGESSKSKIKVNDKEIISFDFKKIIDSQFTEGNVNEEMKISIKDKLNFGVYSKAPNGGFLNFYIPTTNKSFILISGVIEVSNSQYSVEIFKVFKVLK